MHSPSKPRAWPAPDLLIPLALIVAALLLFQPWAIGSLDPWDYGDFYPRVRDTHSVWESFRALVQMYGRENGRFNVVFWWTIAAQWHEFRLSPTGWESVRFSCMAIDVALCYVLFRRLQGSQFAAGAAAGLLVTSMTIYRDWLTLMAEPMSLAVVLAASHLAVGFRRAERWLGRAVLLAAASVLVAWTKEITVPSLLVPWGIAVGWTGGWRRPQADRRSVVLTVLMVSATFAALVPAVLFLRAAPRWGYTAQYGAGAVTPDRLAGFLASALLPAFPAFAPVTQVLHPANLAFLAIMTLGVVARPRDAEGLAHPGGFLGLAVATICVSVYLPWPVFREFYATPAVFAVLIAFATAVERLHRSARPHKIAVAMLSSVLLLASAGTTGVLSAQASALRSLGAASWALLPRLANHDSVFFAVPSEGVERFPARALFLKEMAIATDASDSASLPPFVDVRCPELAPRVRAAGPERVAVIAWYRVCGALPSALRIAAQPTTGWPLPTSFPGAFAELYAPRGLDAPRQGPQ